MCHLLATGIYLCANLVSAVTTRNILETEIYPQAIVQETQIVQEHTSCDPNARYWDYSTTDQSRYYDFSLASDWSCN